MSIEKEETRDSKDKSVPEKDKSVHNVFLEDSLFAKNTNASPNASKLESNNASMKQYGLPSLELHDSTSSGEKNSSRESDKNDYVKLLGDDKVLLAANLTHGENPSLVNKLGEIIDQLKNANPPVKSVGIEGFPASWNKDFDDYFKNPEGKGNREKVMDHIKDYAKRAVGDETKRGEFEKNMMETVDKAREANMRIVGLEAPVPLDQHPGESQNWMLPTSAAKAILEDYKGPDGQTGADLLKAYNSTDEQTSSKARQAMYDFLASRDKTFQLDRTDDNTGNLKPVTNPTDNATAAKDALAALDKMKEHGFFDKEFLDHPPMDGNNFDKEAFKDHVLSWRSKVMAEYIAKALENGRMVVSVGAGHLAGQDKIKSIDGYLAEKKITARDLPGDQ